MQANPKIGSMDAVLDKLYGKVGSPEREEFRKEDHYGFTPLYISS